MKHKLIISALLLISHFGYGQITAAEKLFYDANVRLIGFAKDRHRISDEDYNYCIQKYSQAIKLNPKYWQAYKNRAILKINREDYKEAIADLNAALKFVNKEESITIRHHRGECYYFLGMYEKAIVDYSFIIENGQSEHYRRAQCRQKLGQIDAACSDYRKAIEINKNLKSYNDFLECK